MASQPPPITRRLPSLSLFFPCHNEVDNIGGLVERALQLMPDVADEFEIIIVDDGSVDGTGPLADSIAAQHPQVHAVHHEKNRGYGGALQSGFAAARHEYIFFTDGDGQFDLGEITKLVALLDEADMGIGWRIRRADSLVRVINAKAYMSMIRLLFRLRVRDIDCAFKLIPRRMIERIQLAATVPSSAPNCSSRPARRASPSPRPASIITPASRVSNPAPDSP